VTDTPLVAVAPCWCCKTPFGFDPDAVTSIPIDPDRQLPPDLGGDPAKAILMPLCPGCVARASAQRAAGRPQFRARKVGGG
jgi:hypothetical protein